MVRRRTVRATWRSTADEVRGCSLRGVVASCTRGEDPLQARAHCADGGRRYRWPAASPYAPATRSPCRTREVADDTGHHHREVALGHVQRRSSPPCSGRWRPRAARCACGRATYRLTSSVPLRADAFQSMSFTSSPRHVLPQVGEVHAAAGVQGARTPPRAGRGPCGARGWAQAGLDPGQEVRATGALRATGRPRTRRRSSTSAGTPSASGLEAQVDAGAGARCAAAAARPRGSRRLRPSSTASARATW